jgi:hypothetical protein
MNPLLLRFLKKLTLISLALAFLSAIAFTTILRPWFFPYFPPLFAFVLVFTFLTYAFMVKRADKDFGKFIRAIMVITVLRLFVYIVITVLYAVCIKEKLMAFAITLGLFYLVYTSLEVSELIRWSDKDKNMIRKSD